MSLSVLKTYKTLIKELPDLFDPTNILPLGKYCKKNIVKESGISHAKVSEFLNEYTRFVLYKLAITKNKTRFNTHGKACGIVTEFERESAIKALMAYEKAKNKANASSSKTLKKPKVTSKITKSTLPKRSWGRAIDKPKESAKL